jgi:hypothetical protein
MPAIASEQR